MYIKKLQLKDEGVRKQILAGSLIVSMVLVGFVWMYSLNDRFGHKEVVATESAQSGVKPFTLFSNSISSVFQNISASVGNFSLSKKSEVTTEKQIDLIVVEHPTRQ